MKIIRPGEIKPTLETRPLFTGGTVTKQTIVDTEMSQSFNSVLINFAPQARNKFHSHTGDQILIVTEGRGIVATESEEMTVTIGDIVFIPAEEKHWHGATKDSSFSHISIQAKGSQTSQIEE